MANDVLPLYELKERLRRSEETIRIAGPGGSARSYFLTRFLADLQRPCVVVAPDRKEAERVYKELQFFLSESGPGDAFSGRLHTFPAYDLTPLTGLSPHKEVVTRRLEALYALLSHKNPVVIACLDAICFRILPKSSFVGALEYVESGEDLEREALIEKLEANGYQRAALVEERGDYSVRGGLVDLFAPAYSFPLRLEFWGDRLESIRQFDSVSQRSRKPLREAVLLPASEIVMARENLKRARSMGRLPWRSGQGSAFSGQEAWLNHFYERLDSLFDYLPEEALVVSLEPHRFEEAFDRVRGRFLEDVKRFRNEAAEKGAPFPECEGLLAPFLEISSRFDRFEEVAFDSFLLERPGEPGGESALEVRGALEMDAGLEMRLAGEGRVSLAPLAERIAQWLEHGGRVVLVVRTEQQGARLKEILENYEVHTESVVNRWTDIPQKPDLYICVGKITKGFVWPDVGLYVLCEDEIFGAKRGRGGKKGASESGGSAVAHLGQIKSGDPVVHEEHGVGIFRGLKKMEIENKANDFAVIEYARQDRLYIPADRVSILQKYVGVEGANPKLDQLGGRSWNVAKQKAKRSVKRIAKQLIELYALRKYREGYAFSPPDPFYTEFEATFEHEETSDQVKAIEDVIEDMTSERPMDRLICGDVGFGKTEVAVRAAFKAVSDGKQVALLVPTTVLAEQHYETVHERMHPYGIRTSILSRFKSPAEQNRILAKLRSGKLDIIIGTHRLLQKDIHFNDLGLLIIDEEQRFGVKQKEAIKKYRSLVDVLALTATPIPRTFQMSLIGVRDLSIIETPPEDRQAIQTYLAPYEDALIKRAIETELGRRGQVFFVQNRVQGIEKMAEHLKQLAPRARFAVAHGQMKARDLEKTMVRFLKKEIDVLVCTTIIESGLDIPSANTIIINESDRLGLAQIYQLRGRVGRSEQQAYAYLLVSNGAGLTRDAEKRLKALMDFSHLGAGLHLAMHDLKIRGGGNILGYSQSGNISAVGYELYVKLIERAVRELKGEEWHDELNPEINVGIPAFLPEDYVIDEDVRLNLYRRLSSLRERPELDATAEEIRDRFGPLPPEATNLLGLMGLRLIAKNLGISRMDAAGRFVTLTFSSQNKISTQGLVQAATREPAKYRFVSQERLRVDLGRISLPRDLEKIGQVLESLKSVE